MLKLRTAIATNRFGLGARAGDASSIGDDPRDWLLSQVNRPAETASRSGGRQASAVVLEEIRELRLIRNAVASARNNEAVTDDNGAIVEFARYIANAYHDQAVKSCQDAITAGQPFRERLVRFWENHFAVSADKQPVGAIAGLYRDEAIRPHVTGNFRDLLTAAIKHPAMLLYLDNPQSIGPNSLLGRRASRNRNAGLNENLAREILELHTLGVDGGYSQDDVIELSKALTGWSVGGTGTGERLGALLRRLGGDDESGAAGEFVFRSAVHEPGAKRILGERFSEGDVDEAESILGFLARQPQTARFVATKLARHFVADQPPPALVEQLAASFLASNGELEPVYRQLVLAEASWQQALSKQKRPEEYLVSAWRALDIQPAENSIVALATEFGQRPMTPGSPAGWPDTAADWNGGDALLKRFEWAETVGRSVGDRIDAKSRLEEVLGETASDATRLAIARAASGAQAISLLLSAPEFQRR